MSATPETIEGTWDEIRLQADKFNGHRLRVTILPDRPENQEQTQSVPPLTPTGRYAARMRA